MADSISNQCILCKYLGTKTITRLFWALCIKIYLEQTPKVHQMGSTRHRRPTRHMYYSRFFLGSGSSCVLKSASECPQQVGDIKIARMWWYNNVVRTHLSSLVI